MKNILMMTTAILLIFISGCILPDIDFIDGGITAGKSTAEVVALAVDENTYTFTLPGDGDSITWYGRFAAADNTLSVRLYNDGGTLYAAAGKDGVEATPLAFYSGAASDTFKMDGLEFHNEIGEGKAGIYLEVSINGGDAVIEKHGHENALQVYDGVKTGYLFGYLLGGNATLSAGEGEVEFEKGHHEH